MSIAATRGMSDPGRHLMQLTASCSSSRETDGLFGCHAHARRGHELMRVALQHAHVNAGMAPGTAFGCDRILRPITAHGS